MGRKRYTANEKMEIIENYFKSKMTVKNYCHSIDLCPQTFYQWKKLVNSISSFQDLTPIVRQEIRLKKEEIDHSIVKMTLPNGTRIEFDSSQFQFVWQIIK